MPQSTNKATVSTNGIITTPHCLASQAGLEIFQQGGNAVDAADRICCYLDGGLPSHE